MKTTMLTVLLSALTLSAAAQSSVINISSEIKFPKDSLERQHLFLSLNQFLKIAQKDSRNSELIYPTYHLQTSLLLDEIMEIEKRKNAVYAPYLLDITPIENDQLLILLNYARNINGIPEIRANIQLIAHKSEDRYLFSSPLVKNTKDWKITKIENVMFHYRDTFNVEKARDYIELCHFYDRKLNVEPKTVHYYLVDNGTSSQHLFGLPYKLDYNGRTGKMAWHTELDTQSIYIRHQSSFNRFDPHDLWHARLSNVKSRRTVNHAVDEGIAYLYGGSWGLNWKAIFTAFYTELSFDKKTNWLLLRQKKTTFKTSGMTNRTDYIINALFVKRIEKEHSFSAIWELLNSMGDDNYFKTLNKLIGITRNNYNKEVWKLVKQELIDLEVLYK